jgi:hypothetical protein
MSRSQRSSKDKYVKIYDVEGNNFPSGSSVSDIRIKELDLDTIYPRSITDFNGSRQIIIGKPGCFSKGTDVLMYNGEVKNIEDIIPGDLIMGDDSTHRRVIELCRGEDDMYDIIPLKDGIELDHCKYRINSKHILTLKDENDNIIDICLKDYLLLENKEKYQGFKTSFDFNIYPSSLEDENDAYIFGCHIYKYYELDPRFVYNSNYNVRIELLKGIIKSSGFIRRDNYYNLVIIRFVKKISEEILFLIHSLGYDGYIEKRDAGYFIIVSIQDNFLYSFKVNKVKKEKYYGFTLSGNNRFLLHDGTVVHNTGKSKLAGSLIWHKRHIFPIGQVYSGTEESNEAYKRMFPDLYIYNKLDELALEKFKTRQKYAKKYLDDESKWAVMIWDDVSSDRKFYNKPIVQEYYKNGRHWNLFHLNCQQYSLDMGPALRVCQDGSFLLRESNSKNRKKIWENYAGIIENYNDFEDLMDGLTTDHNSLYVNNRTNSNKLEDCVFYYKADLEKIPMIKSGNQVEFDFRVGSEAFWNQSQIRSKDKEEI